MKDFEIDSENLSPALSLDEKSREIPKKIYDMAQMVVSSLVVVIIDTCYFKPIPTTRSVPSMTYNCCMINS